MKFLDLELMRFGHFSDVNLDFETGARSFHLIFGPNEAGKSTALRAVEGLLFGIPERTPDDHVHKATDLRVGARLENSAAGTIHVLRRKGRKDTLLDPDGRPIDEATLKTYLGGVSRELFGAMFGLSHDALVEGGRELLRGRGEVGESLFAAASGLRGLHRLVASLEEEADEIFKPSAQKPRLNQALARFKDARDEVKQHTLRPAAWRECERALDDAREHVKGLREERAAQGTLLRDREALHRALPDLRAREACLLRQRELGEVILLPEDAGERRRRAQQGASDAAQRAERLSRERVLRVQTLAGLVVPDALLAGELRVKAMAERRGAHLTALGDRRGLAARLEAGRLELASLLRELPKVVPVGEVEALRVDGSSQLRIRRLARDGDRLQSQAHTLEKDLEAGTQRSEAARRAAAELPPGRDTKPLRGVLAVARKAGDIERTLQVLQSGIAAREVRTRQDLSALPLWEGSLEELIALPIPLAETVDRFEGELGEIARRRQILETLAAETEAQREQAAHKVAALESEGEVPSRRDLEHARGERDMAWSEVRGAWLDGRAPSRPPEAVATAYVAHVAAADDVADRMFAEHERVAKLAALREERERIDRSVSAHDLEREALGAQEQTILGEWHAAWAQPGIQPLSPREMRSWLSRHRELTEAIREIDERRRQAADLEREIAKHLGMCRAALHALGEAAGEHEGSLALTLEAIDAFLASVDEIEAKRLRLGSALEEASRQQQLKSHELDHVRTELMAWRSSWAEAVTALHLRENAEPEEAESILEKLDSVFRKVGELDGLQERIRHMDADAREFESSLSALVADLAPDLADAPAPERSASLLRRLEDGLQARTERRSLEARLREIDAELLEVARDQEAAAAILEELSERAGCASIDELEHAEARSAEARRLKGQIEEIESRLHLAGQPLDELAALATVVDQAALEVEIEQLREALERSEHAREEAVAKVAELEHGISLMDGGPAAAEAADKAEQALAEISRLVETYARLRLGASVIGREIRRYGAEHQGPVLRRTGELLQRMTLGSFAGVTSDFGSNDEVVIFCQRATGALVPVDGLSDGTRDQLFLALRLAALEHHMERSEPMPLIVDDVLVSFDDERSRATLELMGEISARTQILFFTHHERLVEIARMAIPEDGLRVHTLEAG